MRCLIAFAFACALVAGEAQLTYELQLKGALPNGRDLRVLLRGDGLNWTAIGHAPTFNRMPYVVVPVKMRAVDKVNLVGGLTVTIPSDGWVPKGGSELVCELGIKQVEGTAPQYAGEVGDQDVHGELVVKQLPEMPTGPARLVLNLENAVDHQEGQKFARGKRLKLTAGIGADGKVHDIKAIPPGSITDTGFCARTEGCELAVKDGKLTGHCVVRIDGMEEKAPTRFYQYSFANPVIGDTVLGEITVINPSAKKTADNKAWVMGEVDRTSTGKSPGDGLYTIRIFDVPRNNKYTVLYLAVKDLQFTHGFAATPNYNNATHTLDCSKLRLTKSWTIDGEVKVTVHPDPWIPPEQEDQEFTFVLDAKTIGSELTGKVTSPTIDHELTLDGWIDPLPATGPIEKMTLKLENALVGGNKWHNRAFLGMKFVDGKLVSGKVGNNHTKLKGTVDGGDLRIEEGKIVGDVKITVAEGGGVTAGAYSFAIDAPLVGRIGAGSYTTTAPDGSTKTGRLWGAVSFAAE